MVRQKDYTGKEPIEEGQGVVFTAFDLIKKPVRYNQLTKWLGKDFDGVIVFDEAHKMGNALDATVGGGFTKEASERAKAGVQLQTDFPKAKIVYASATGATEIDNLAYAHRLGIWGRGTPFNDQREFIQQVGQQGLAAMEVLSKDLKSMGLYLSRNLDFRGVEYERIEHTLTPKQREMYDTLARTWQTVLRNMGEALETTGGAKDRWAKQAASKAFWGAHQRFFNQVLTSLQTETVKSKIRESLDAGHSVVLQLVNTMAAATDRAIARASAEAGEGEVDLENLDITPRDALAEYVRNSWPVNQYEEYVDDNGNVATRQVLDAAGNPVINREAVAQRDRMISQLASVLVPPGALDDIIDTFGVENVAEVTSRSRRVVTVDTPEGRRRIIQPRNSNAGLADRSQFDAGKKRILVFSEAGGTGANYHADKAIPNQQPRDHYVLQPGWKADAAVQGLGRTHRSNQAQPPKYFLVSTDVPGHKRFVSTIARRIEQLGALTKGQRETTSQGLFKASDNLESSYARETLRAFLRAVSSNAIKGISGADFIEQTGIKLFSKDGDYVGDNVPMSQFLNRLLSMSLGMQDRVFNEFGKNLDATIEWHKKNGTLDVGLETLMALHTVKTDDVTLRKDAETGVETHLVTLEQTHPTQKQPFDRRWLKGDTDFFINRRSGKLWAIGPAFDRAKADGTTESRRWATSVNYSSEILASGEVNEDRFQPVPKETAERIWQQHIDALPPTYTENVHLVTGALLPAWDKIPYIRRIARAQEDGGARHLGVVLAEDYVSRLLQNFGVDQKIELSPKDAFDRILDKGAAISLSNDWMIKRSRVAQEDRIEIIGPDYSDQPHLQADGVIMEQINWKMRYFIPTSEAGRGVMERILKDRPIIDIQGGPRDLSLATEQGSPGEAKSVVDWLQSHGVLDRYPGLKMEAVGNIPGGATGEYQATGPREGIARFLDWSKSETPWHEFSHHIFRFISPDDRAFVRKARIADLMSVINDLPNDVSGRFMSGKMTSRRVNHRRAGRGQVLPPDQRLRILRVDDVQEGRPGNGQA